MDERETSDTEKLRDLSQMLGFTKRVKDDLGEKEAIVLSMTDIRRINAILRRVLTPKRRTDILPDSDELEELKSVLNEILEKIEIRTEDAYDDARVIETFEKLKNAYLMKRSPPRQ